MNCWGNPGPRCTGSATRSRPGKKRPPAAPAADPAALSDAERAAVLAVLDSERFADKSPAQAWAVLLDEGCYLCSIRTMYRILDGAGQVRERRAQASHPPRVRPELVATGPDQVGPGTSRN